MVTSGVVVVDIIVDDIIVDIREEPIEGEAAVAVEIDDIIVVGLEVVVSIGVVVDMIGETS